MKRKISKRGYRVLAIVWAMASASMAVAAIRQLAPPKPPPPRRGGGGPSALCGKPLDPSQQRSKPSPPKTCGWSRASCGSDASRLMNGLTL